MGMEATSDTRQFPTPCAPLRHEGSLGVGLGVLETRVLRIPRVGCVWCCRAAPCLCAACRVSLCVHCVSCVCVRSLCKFVALAAWFSVSCCLRSCFGHFLAPTEHCTVCVCFPGDKLNRVLLGVLSADTCTELTRRPGQAGLIPAAADFIQHITCSARQSCPKKMLLRRKLY